MNEPPGHSAPDTWPRPRPFILMAVITLYAAGLLHGVTLPWIGMQEWNGAFFTYVTRNLMRYPVSLSHLLPVVEIGPPAADAGAVQLYATHPPGLPWLLAGAFTVLGESEWAARMVPIACSLASLWLLMRIVSSTLSRPAGILAGLFYAVMPMSVYFGRMVNHEAVVMFFVLLSWWGWLAGRGVVATGRSAAVCHAAWLAGMAASIWIDWPGCIAAAILLAHALLLHRRGQATVTHVALSAVAPLVVTAAAFAWLVYGGMGGSWAALRDMAMSRAVQSGGEAGDAADAAPLRRDVSMRGGPLLLTLDNFGPALLAWSAVGLGVAAARSRRGSPVTHSARPTSWSPLWMLTALGAAWLILFWRQFLRHNYWQFYLGPPAAVFAALGMLRVHDGLRAAGMRERAAETLSVALLAATVIASLWGVDDYFERRSFSRDRIQALQSIVAQTRPDDTILLFERIEETDRRGAYQYRNLVPPHLPCYLDRRVRQASDPAAFAARAEQASVLLVLGDLARPGSAAWDLLNAIGDRYPQYLRHPYIVVDLQPDRGRALGERIR